MLPMPDRDLPRRISGCPLDMRNTGSKIGTPMRQKRLWKLECSHDKKRLCYSAGGYERM